MYTNLVTLHPTMVNTPILVSTTPGGYSCGDTLEGGGGRGGWGPPRNSLGDSLGIPEGIPLWIS